MAETDELYFKVNSQGVVKAYKNLDEMTRASKQSSKAVDGVNRATGKASPQVKKLGTEAKRTSNNLKGINTSSVLARAGIVALGFIAVRSLSAPSKAALNFGKNIAEVSTLIQGTRAQIAGLERDTLALTATYGGRASDQAQGFYAAYSAGAKNAADALAIVTAGNKLALGGVATLDSSLLLLTGTLNAYTEFGYEAGRVSDIFFEVVKNGITTIPKLAAAFSNVSATAANFGVNLETTGSAVAAITATGTQTAVATTQVRALLSALQKLSPEAKAFAKTLGVTSTAPKDLAQIITQLTTALDSVVDPTERANILFKLFGTEIEALNAGFNLTGGGAATFQKTLKATANSAGATDEAVAKLADTMSNRLNIAVGKVDKAKILFGKQLNKVLIPALTKGASLIEFFADNMDIAAGIAAGVLSIAVVGLTAKMIALGAAVTAVTGGLNLVVLGAVAVGAITFGGATYAFANLASSATTTAGELDKVVVKQRELNELLEAGNVKGLKAIEIAATAQLEAYKADLKRLEYQNTPGFLSLFGIGNVDLEGLKQETALREIITDLEQNKNISTAFARIASDVDKAKVSAISLNGEFAETLLFLEAGANAETPLQALKTRYDTERAGLEQRIALTKEYIATAERANAGGNPNERVAQTNLQQATANLGLLEGALDKTTAAYQTGRAHIIATNKETKTLDKTTQDLTKSVKTLADAYDDDLRKSISGSVRAFTGFIDGSTKSFDDFAIKIKDRALGLLADLTATFATNKILIQLGLGGLNNFGSVAGAGVFGQFLNTSGGGQFTRDQFRREAFGGGGVAAGAGQAFGVGGAGITAGFGANVGTLFGGGSVAGGAGLLAGGALVGGLLAGVAAAGLALRKLLDSGPATDLATFRVNDDGQTTSATNQRSRRNGILRQIFTGETHSVAISALDAEVRKGLEKVFSTTAREVSGYAEAIGGSVSSLAGGFDNVNLATMDAATIQKNYANTIASTIDGLGAFIMNGETAVQALDNIASHFTSFNNVLTAFGFTALDASVSVAGAVRDISVALDKVQGQTGEDGKVIAGSGAAVGTAGLFDFRSPEQQLETISKRVLDAIGSVPETAAELAARLTELEEAFIGNPTSADGKRFASALLLSTQADFRKLLSLQNSESGSGAVGVSRGAFSPSSGALSADNFATANEQRVAIAIARNAFGESELQKQTRLAQQTLDEIVKQTEVARQKLADDRTYRAKEKNRS